MEVIFLGMNSDATLQVLSESRNWRDKNDIWTQSHIWLPNNNTQSMC